LLVLTEFPPDIGGMQTHAMELARRLHERGYEIEVMTYRTPDPAAAAFDATLPYRVERVLSRIGHWRNVDLVSTRARRADLVYASTVYYGLVSAGVPVVCRSAGNDLQRPWIAWPFRAGAGLVSVPWFEDRAYRWFRKRKGPDWVQRLFEERRGRLVREALSGNAFVFANSAYTGEVVAEFGLPRSRWEVLAGGVDCSRFRGVDRAAARAALGLDDGYWLMTACRLVPKKGIEFLLRALPALIAARPDTRLLIVGDGPERERYVSMAAELGDRVRFAGRLPFEQMPVAYAASDCFVLASHDVPVKRGRGTDVETMGRVLCEANAAGVPVIASRCGGVPSVIEHNRNGLLFTPEDAAGLLRSYERLRGEEGLADALARRGRKIAARRFDWSVIVDRHEQVFARMMEARVAPALSGSIVPNEA
jgi:glycosyltransferase involved in cell wall biosynthesis